MQSRGPIFRIFPIMVVIATFAFSSCGIDAILYLSDKPISKSDSKSALEFTIQSDDDFFFGVNLYYRIYASMAEADSDLSTLESKQSSNSIPGSFLPYLENTMKYTRQAVSLLDTPEVIVRVPTIPDSDILPLPNFISIMLIRGRLFLDIDSTLPTLSNDDIDGGAYSGDDVFELLRNTGTGTPKSFNELPVSGSGDTDFQEEDDGEGFYYIQFFAASYGFDLAGSSTELYSNAVYLGRIVINRMAIE